MSTICIITARGGSKRIPRKNIKDFCGKPILAYSIEAALESGAFDTVMVSTDDAEIARIAKAYGAEVPFFREAKTSDDFATTRDVVLEVLAAYEALGQRFEQACCVYPTAPFLTAARLKEAMALLLTSGADSVVPVVRFGFPPQRGVVIKEGLMAFAQPEHALTRSQDLEPMYHDAGQFYAMDVRAFLAQKMLVMERTAPLILDEMEVQDIDTFKDWEIAEMKYRLLKKDE